MGKIFFTQFLPPSHSLQDIHPEVKVLHNQAKQSVQDTNDPKGKVLCEVTSDVLDDFGKLFDHYTEKS